MRTHLPLGMNSNQDMSLQVSASATDACFFNVCAFLHPY